MDRQDDRRRLVASGNPAMQFYDIVDGGVVGRICMQMADEPTQLSDSDFA